ncbi:hypothetical protein [uncultured Paludibaculum sp.]|uniref:hypothetical protein n=1 Tax=uncultured Paludibaculum sp. TaxID=1765020 RepID=UPI002AAA9F5E|nr:hypothetical protein [uncultured Paludibaculum sp.]
MNNARFGMPLALVIASVLGLPARGQDLLAAKEGRGLSQLARELQIRYGFLVSYEEAPFDFRRDVVRIQGAHGEYAYSSIRSIPITFDLSPLRGEGNGLSPDTGGSRDGAISQGAVRTMDRGVITSLIEQYNTSGNPGRFSAMFDGDSVHIIPSGRSVDGRIVEFVPILSTQITLADRVAPCIDVLHELLNEVGKTRGVAVQEGVVPLNSFLNGQLCKVKGDAQVARDALSQILSDVGRDSRFPPAFPRRRFSWALHHDVNTGAYFLNIRMVREDKVQSADSGTSSTNAAVPGAPPKGYEVTKSK